MKRHLLPLVILLVPLAATVLWAWIPRTVPPERVSDLYRRYEHTPHLTVAYIEDFPLNDTLTVDATILKFQDSTTWADNILQLHNINKEKGFNPQTISFKMINKGTERYLIASNLNDLTIGFFLIETDQQYDAIFDNYFNKSYI